MIFGIFLISVVTLEWILSRAEWKQSSPPAAGEAVGAATSTDGDTGTGTQDLVALMNAVERAERPAGVPLQGQPRRG